MASLEALVKRFTDKERPAANILDGSDILAQAVVATAFYAGYADIVSHKGVTPEPEIAEETVISVSEWALIRPLFILYVERENALQLEASRGHGVDVFGRSSSEIAADIAQAEAEFPHRAFCHPIITVD